jgi:hypothetical protein
MTKASGITSVEKWPASKTPGKMAASRPALRRRTSHPNSKNRSRTARPARHPADEIEKALSGLFNLDPTSVAKLKEVLYN